MCVLRSRPPPLLQIYPPARARNEATVKILSRSINLTKKMSRQLLWRVEFISAYHFRIIFNTVYFIVNLNIMTLNSRAIAFITAFSFCQNKRRERESLSRGEVTALSLFKKKKKRSKKSLRISGSTSAIAKNVSLLISTRETREPHC